MSRWDERDRPDRQDRVTEYVNVEGMIDKTTDKALRLWDGENTFWLPISQCRGLPEVIPIKVHLEFQVAEWIAKQKGLI